MKYGTVRTRAVVGFATAREAQRPVAGVPVAARILRELARAGFTDAWIEVSDGLPIDAPALAEIRRLAAAMTVHLQAPPEDLPVVRFPADRLIAAEAIPDFLAGVPYPFTRLDTPGATAEILRGTGKSGDGLVSRWINRPISRQLSAILLRVPGIRPIHATIGTALIAAAMSIALVFGGRYGLLVGALLFQTASIFDGVDGEIARATFRTSRTGAAVDSAIDAATNFAAMLGMAINLALRGRPEALALATWGLALLLLGWAMIGLRSLRETGSVSFDGVKHRYRGRFSGPVAARLMALATLGTSRDFCALVYLLLVVGRIPIAGLYLFAVVTPVWILFVIAALWPSRDDERAASEGAA
ncbi:MAG TPA: CDP-alcohol phosphatidyltransferase family protein [Croceibacterium sp.]|jgi:CDP-L-myo-inositol myo-inositolphosphotransferase